MTTSKSLLKMQKRNKGSILVDKKIEVKKIKSELCDKLPANGRTPDLIEYILHILLISIILFLVAFIITIITFATTDMGWTVEWKVMTGLFSLLGVALGGVTYTLRRLTHISVDKNDSKTKLELREQKFKHYMAKKELKYQQKKR